MRHNAPLLHGGELGLSGGQLLWIRRPGFVNTREPGSVSRWWRIWWRGGEAMKSSEERTSGNSERRSEIH